MITPPEHREPLAKNLKEKFIFQQDIKGLMLEIKLSAFQIFHFGIITDQAVLSKIITICDKVFKLTGTQFDSH